MWTCHNKQENGFIHYSSAWLQRAIEIIDWYCKTAQAKLLVIEMNCYQTSEKCNLNSEFVTGSEQSIAPKWNFQFRKMDDRAIECYDGMLCLPILRWFNWSPEEMQVVRSKKKK